MDEQVLQAMARWPNVPAVYGWLRLGRRGRWFLIDRNSPGFDERIHGDGSPIGNEQINEFIARNYQAEADGRWYWQNGPQRVYVDLQAAPLVVRVLGAGQRPRLVDHTGVEIDIAAVRAAGTGPAGELLLVTDRGAAVVHDLDLGSLAIEPGADGEAGVLLLGERRIALVEWTDPPTQLGFVTKPRQAG